MSNYVSYPLHAGGTVARWLACGPAVTPLAQGGREGAGPAALAAAVSATGSPFGERGRWTLSYWAWDERVQATKGRIYQALDPAVELVDPAPELAKPVGKDLRWDYLALAHEGAGDPGREAASDGTADFSRFSHTPALFSGHLYAEIVAERPGAREVELITIGPAHLWLAGRLVHSQRGPFGYAHPRRIRLSVPFGAGVNGLWLRGDMIGLREARLALGLRFLDPAGLRVRLPIGERSPAAWREAERCLAAVRVGGEVVEGATVSARVAADANAAVTFRVAAELATDPPVRSPLGSFTADPGESVSLMLPDEVRRGVASTLSEAGVTLILEPAGELPLERRIPLLVATAPASLAPYGSYASRQHEALEHLARLDADVLGSAAAVRTGAAETIASSAVASSLRFLQERRDTADFHALALLAVSYWYGGGSALDARDEAAITGAFRDFKYWLDEPGLDAMCYVTENHQILFHACEYLAAQRWPDTTFSNCGLTGAARLPAARRRILAWLARRLRSSFSEWDSNAYLAMDAFALLALVEFAEDGELTAAARALLDKLFFMLAAQSFRGTHGCTHGRCYLSALTSGRNDATAGLQRIAWGMGSFNGETRAPALLAMSERYTVPEVIQAIGADLPEALVTQAHALGDFVPEADMRGDGWDVRTLTRRTPDYQLAAALDQRPGELGVQEHLWQATFGSEAVVFTSYPGNALEHGEARPNFWAGSARLPHVGMHGRTVLCLYRFDGALGLGYSHAYFPSESFDAWRLEGAWAFARRGSGYLALWGDGRLALASQGRYAGRELRSAGPGSAWLCTVGSAAEDGDFQVFCQRLLAAEPPQVAAVATSREARAGTAPEADAGTAGEAEVAGVAVRAAPAGRTRLRWREPGGSALALTWREGLRVDGDLLDTAAFPHYRNRYTDTALGAAAMVLEHAGLRHVIPLRPGGAAVAPSVRRAS